MDPDLSQRNGLIKRIRSSFKRNGQTSTTISSVPSEMKTFFPSDMRLRVAEFEAARVEDVMIPRAEIVALEVSDSFSTVIQRFAEATHSRLPVYRESLDDPIGFVHIKDVVAQFASQSLGEESATPSKTPLLSDMVRDILYVPASMRLPDLLVKMQSSRIHLALVVDEYGGTDGLVSLEDLVEEIVGNIEDEHDEDSPGLSHRGKGVWDADARVEIDDVAEQTGLELSLPDYADDIDTLGGIVFAIAGRVPQRGEIIRHPNGVDLEILEADPRRIKRLRLRSTAAPTHSAQQKPATSNGAAS